ncbi:YceI family protein [Rugosimonospora acidiphila]|uniref:YceI family protein n=1 Tax=Rugosimonospora acidiphila TaxID=556531 RepID=A0ABP9SNX7_9ACTN
MPEAARSVRCGPETGSLLLRTRREGFAARAGHDLTIEATRWSARIDLPAGDLAAAHVTASIDLDSLTVREATGGARPLTPADRQDIEDTARRLLGGGQAGFESVTVRPSEPGDPAGDGGTIDGELTLRGVARPLRLDVSATGDDRYRAVASVIQSAYGIKPYSAFLGALKLRDEVSVEVEVDLRRAGAGDSPTPGDRPPTG